MQHLRVIGIRLAIAAALVAAALPVGGWKWGGWLHPASPARRSAASGRRYPFLRASASSRATLWTNTETTRGSNCAPALRSSSAIATSCETRDR